ncbi:hypothetical protein PGQ11_010808 [Apiospora arundinis]|uniref:Uncharacterized protein n=1 Tax=Apiospora arundinis TaxID=335852 RepID=A0ABR2IBN7_9PEZI
MTGNTHGGPGMTGSNTHGTGMTGNTHSSPMTGNTHGTTGMTGSNHGVTGSHNNHGAAGMAGAGAAAGAAGAAGAHHMSGSDDMTGNTHGGPGMTGSNTHGTAGMTGSNTHGTGMTGNNHGTPGMMTGATGTNDRYDDRINPGVPTTGGMNTGATTGTGSSGMASNLTHRPADNSSHVRDHKVNEYDAPTNSSGRGKQGLAGAAGGVAASELAHRHHKDDMRDYNTPTSGTSSTDRGLNTAERWHNTSGAADPSMGNTTTGQHGMTGHHNNSGGMLDYTSTGDHMSGARSGSMGNNYTSLLDPHNNTSRTTYGHDTTHPSHGMMGGNDHVTDSRVAGDNMGSTHGAPGMTGSNHGMTGSNTHGDNTIRAVPHQDNMGGNMGTHSGIAGGNTSPSHHNNPLSGGSHSTGMGDGHMGPGHAAAKVMHRCDHCGNDNDISKYFSKEAVYRMS